MKTLLSALCLTYIILVFWHGHTLRDYLAMGRNQIEIKTKNGTVIVKGDFWSWEVEKLLHIGLADGNINNDLHTKEVKSLSFPTKTRCGHAKNMFVTFKDGTHACARNRDGEQGRERVLGELRSFYLAKLLGINNVPPVMLSKVNPESKFWRSASQDIISAKWVVGSVVAIIQWIDGLTVTKIPDLVKGFLLDKQDMHDSQNYQHMEGQFNQKFVGSLVNLNLTNVGLLAQWSDLVVFDFLTGNCDRFLKLKKTGKWEHSSLSEPINNLVVSNRTGSLWFIDNECGMLSKCLYERDRKNWKRTTELHIDLLQTTCIFRRNTVDRVLSIHREGDSLTSVLDSFISSKEPLYQEFLSKEEDQDLAYRKHLHGRVEKASTWMKQCQEKDKLPN